MSNRSSGDTVGQAKASLFAISINIQRFYIFFLCLEQITRNSRYLTVMRVTYVELDDSYGVIQLCYIYEWVRKFRICSSVDVGGRLYHILGEWIINRGKCVVALYN